jgi:cell division septum initiation protein DivIVA
MINRIGTKGEVIAVDDIIATLEQENRQLHARNERLQKELDEAYDRCAEICEDRFASDGLWCAKAIRELKNAC